MDFSNVYNHFDQWNEIIFSGELFTPDIEIMSSNEINEYIGEHWDIAGCTIHDNDGYTKIILCSDYCSNYVDYHATLLHEMIHIDQIQAKLPMNHKKRFKNAAKFILRNYGISV